MQGILLVILGISFIFLMTITGAAFVYFFKKNLDDKFQNIMLGFASGIMIASSIWSMILPAIDFAKDGLINPVISIVGGIILGSITLIIVDKIISSNLKSFKKEKYGSTLKLFSAVTLHNIPEGLAVGLAFGIALNQEINGIIPALMLALGIGIQNVPEGAAVSLPFYAINKNKNKSFIFGSLSGIVEPIFAIIGVLLSKFLTDYMPLFLAFAAGSMLYVVMDELIPEATKNEKHREVSIAFIVGFIIMMTFDMLF